MKIFALIITILWVGTTGYSQKKFVTRGVAQVRIENSMSKQQARQAAKKLAIINAIENVLGTYVEQETNITIESGNTNFHVIANTKVKGEWIETKDEKFSEDTRIVQGEHGKETEIWVTCNITGRVREIIKANLAFEILPLNCPNKNCRQTDFLVDELLYVYFRSPSKGFLSIYLQEGETVFRLLPYSQMEGEYLNAVPVKADKKYLFFSAKEEHNYFNNFHYSQIDELEMYTEKDVEYMKMYVVFSTKMFTKPILEDGKVQEESYVLPKSLTTREFEDWIEKNRIYNPDFNYEIINMSVKK